MSSPRPASLAGRLGVRQNESATKEVTPAEEELCFSVALSSPTVMKAVEVHWDPWLLGGRGADAARRGLSPRIVGDEHRGVLVLGGKVGHTFKVVAWHDQMPTRRCGHRQQAGAWRPLYFVAAGTGEG